MATKRLKIPTAARADLNLPPPPPATTAPKPPEPLSQALGVARVGNGYIITTSHGPADGFRDQRKLVARDATELVTLVRLWAVPPAPAKQPARAAKPATS